MIASRLTHSGLRCLCLKKSGADLPRVTRIKNFKGAELKLPVKERRSVKTELNRFIYAN